jgi:hypothetical protein
MTRRLDKLKADVRKYFDFKRLTKWIGYRSYQKDGYGVEEIWNKAIEHYEEQIEVAKKLQRIYRSNSVLTPTEMVNIPSRHGDQIKDYRFDLSETDEAGILREVRRALRFNFPKSESGTALYYGIIAVGSTGSGFEVPPYPSKELAYDMFAKKLGKNLLNTK